MIVAVAALLVFSALVIGSPRGLTFDEPAYLSSVAILERDGLSRRFLQELPGLAGPLYTFVQYSLNPITGLQPPGVRIINLVLAAATVAALIGCLRAMKAPGTTLAGFDLLCVPGLGVSSCLALTEMPALFMVTVSMLLLFVSIGRDERLSAMTICTAIAGGIFLGLAILGRQPYLVVLGALPIFSLGRDLRHTAIAVVFGAAAAAVCVPVFIVWRGLVPPLSASAESGISPVNGVLAAAYAAVILAVLAPRFFALRPKHGLLVFAGSILANGATGLIAVTPLRTVVIRFFPPVVVALYTSVVSGLFLGAGILFIVATIRNAWSRREHLGFVFCAIAALLTVAACAKITHQMSSRYVIAAAPMLVVMGVFYSRPSWAKAVRLAGGAAISAVAVWSYLYA